VQIFTIFWCQFAQIFAHAKVTWYSSTEIARVPRLGVDWNDKKSRRSSYFGRIYKPPWRVTVTHYSIWFNVTLCYCVWRGPKSRGSNTRLCFDYIFYQRFDELNNIISHSSQSHGNLLVLSAGQMQVRRWAPVITFDTSRASTHLDRSVLIFGVDRCKNEHPGSQSGFNSGNRFGIFQSGMTGSTGGGFTGMEISPFPCPLSANIRFRYKP
jgi:hypothetical protein